MTMRRFKEDTPEYKANIKATHRRSAEKLLALARVNGGVFIKVTVFAD